MTTNETLKQTSASESMIQQLKVYAAQQNVLMRDVYERAVINLINHRRELQEHGKKMIYLASNRKGKELNIKIKTNLANRITRIAETDGTSVRRFLYTALVIFAKKHSLNTIEIEVEDGY